MQGNMFLRHNNIFADEVRNQCVWIIEWYLCALCCVHKCSTTFCSSWFSPMDVTVVFKRDRSSVIWTMGINLWWSRTGRDLWVILSLFLLSLHSQFIKKTLTSFLLQHWYFILLLGSSKYYSDFPSKFIQEVYVSSAIFGLYVMWFFLILCLPSWCASKQ